MNGQGNWSVPPNTTYGLVTSSTNGLMSAADKSKLDGLRDINNTPLLAITNVNIYVATNGVDAIGRGLSASTPFKTIQFAINYAKRYVLATNSEIQINLGTGTYNEDISLQYSTSMICINGGSNNPIVQGTILSNFGALLKITNCRLQLNWNRNNKGNYACYNRSYLEFDTCTFLKGVGTLSAYWYAFIHGTYGSFIKMNNCTFDGADITQASWGILIAFEEGGIFHATGTINFINSCKCGCFLSGWRFVTFYIQGDFSGSLEGQQYCISNSSILRIDGRSPNIIPGNPNSGEFGNDSYVVN